MLGDLLGARVDRLNVVLQPFQYPLQDAAANGLRNLFGVGLDQHAVRVHARTGMVAVIYDLPEFIEPGVGLRVHHAGQGQSKQS